VLEDQQQLELLSPIKQIMNPFADSPAKLGSSNPFYETTDRTSDETDEEVPLKADSEHNPINENSLNEETHHDLDDELRIPTASTAPAEFTRIKSSRHPHEITPNSSRGDKLVAALAKKRESKRQMSETAAVAAYAEPTTDIIEVERSDSSTKHNSYTGSNSALTSNKLRGGGEDNSDNKGQIDSGVNLIYHKNRMSEPWLYTTLLIHIAQFTILLVLGHSVLPSAAIIVLVLLVVAVAILLLYSRKLVKKNRKRTSTTLFRKKIEGKTERTPDEETDFIPSGAIYCLCGAAILEGCTFALYTVMMAGHDGLLDTESNRTYGTSSRQIILETMRFASITLLAFHRILRPANRVDPMRTMLEVHPITVQYL
jgi:hypothetical protein